MLLISEKEFKDFSGYYKRYYGIDLTKKKSLIEGRLYNAVKSFGYSSLSEYLEAVFENPGSDAAKDLISRLTTNYSYFMREPLHFEFLSGVVLPELCHNKEADLRVWSAGCATGEEPYTIAMVMAEFFGEKKAMYDTRILATDISSKALKKARSGVFFNDSLERISYGWKSRYFKRLDEERWEVSDSIKKEVIFRAFNMMDEVFPFKKKFHVIFCRNVMIYFDRETRREVVRRLFRHTQDGGYLFIGQSESLDKFETEYKYIKPSIYRKV